MIRSKKPDHSVLTTVLVKHPTLPGETMVVNTEDAAGFELAEPQEAEPQPTPKKASKKVDAQKTEPSTPAAGGDTPTDPPTDPPTGSENDPEAGETVPPGSPKVDFPLAVVKGIGERMEGVLGAKLAAAGMGTAEIVLSAGPEAIAAVLGDQAHFAPKVIEAAKAAQAKA